jgi:hypothetical protein
MKRIFTITALLMIAALAIISQSSYTEAIRAPWSNRFGLGDPEAGGKQYAWDNNFVLKYRNATDTADVEALRVDQGNSVRVDKARVDGDLTTIAYRIEPNAAIADEVFFIADRTYTVEAIQEIHKTAGNDASAVTAALKKAANGTACASGTAIMSSTFNLKGTANTLQTATVATGTTLAENDRVCIDFTGTLTTLAGVTVNLVLSPGHASETATYAVVANGDLADRAFFVAERPMHVSGIKYSAATAGSAGANVQVVKDTSTDAPGAGTDLLTNNTNAGFDTDGTANTVQEGALSATAAALYLDAGDRLSVDFAGTLTALAGVTITVEFDTAHDLKTVTFFSPKDTTTLADQAFFIADRNYRVVAASEVHATAGTDGSAVLAQLTVDNLVEAPGAGHNLLSNTSSTGFNLKGTANTEQIATFIDVRQNHVLQGQRLSVDFAGTHTSLAGVVVSVDLEPF